MGLRVVIALLLLASVFLVATLGIPNWLPGSQFSRQDAVGMSLIAAVSYGLADFLGGTISRRIGTAQTAAVTQLLAAILAFWILLAQGMSFPSQTSAFKSLCAGLCYGSGALLLYEGFAKGRISIVAPISGILNIVIPFSFEHMFIRSLTTFEVVGIAFAGLGAAIITSENSKRSREQEQTHRFSVKAGMLSGVGFGLSDVLIGTTPADQAIGSVVVARGASAMLAFLFVVLTSITVLNRRQGAAAWAAAGVGIGVTPRSIGAPLGINVALICVVGIMEAIGALGYVASATRDSMSVAAALSALFPVVSVLLAVIVLGERPGRRLAFAIGISTTSIAFLY